jgi:hypothetical protein
MPDLGMAPQLINFIVSALVLIRVQEPGNRL